jgi:hypothetical protein
VSFEQGIRQEYFVRECDYLTFLGNPTPDPADDTKILNPVLPNTYELTGALVSAMNPKTETYLDSRTLPSGKANPMAQVAIDFQPGITNALMGLATLPKTFYLNGCPTLAELKAEYESLSVAAKGTR